MGGELRFDSESSFTSPLASAYRNAATTALTIIANRVTVAIAQGFIELSAAP
jgi:hypothetical protein